MVKGAEKQALSLRNVFEKQPLSLSNGLEKEPLSLSNTNIIVFTLLLRRSAYFSNPLRRLSACFSSKLQRLIASFSAPFTLIFLSKSNKFLGKGGQIEVLKLSTLFRKVISFIYNIFYLSDRVPLRCLCVGLVDIKIVSISKMSQIDQKGGCVSIFQKFFKFKNVSNVGGGGGNPNLNIVPIFTGFFY